MLVVVPEHLAFQWLAELFHKFNALFTLLTKERIAEMGGLDVALARSPLAIVSHEQLVANPAVALVAGLWLASIESRPGFDDTGVMVGLLLVVPAVVGGGTRALPDDVRLTLELLDEAGLANEVIAQGLVLNRVAYYDGASRAGELRMSDLHGRFPFLVTLPQSALERILQANPVLVLEISQLVGIHVL